jgi:hypothetical protein
MQVDHKSQDTASENSSTMFKTAAKLKQPLFLRQTTQSRPQTAQIKDKNHQLFQLSKKKDKIPSKYHL